ncbi:MAG: NAD-dependent epimerase/dehydratase family protein [Bdellovibrionales bacterium]|nr:NAD-dependent epimerase/dehydratase family protein [Oligoflexia bacterium]
MEFDAAEEGSQTVLITGGAGFIGTHLCRELIRNGYQVLSLDLKTYPPHPVSGVDYIVGDAREFNTVAHLLKQHAVNAVYHLAATVSVPLCQKDPVESYSQNMSATLNVLEACRMQVKPVRFAFASSAALYGSLGDSRGALSEHTIANRFSSFYAAQKHASEKMIELYCEYYKIPALVFRFFNVYGHGQDPSSPYSGVITIFSKLAKEKKPMTLYNAGEQTRDFIPVTDIVRALASALMLPEEKWDADVINLGSGTSTSVRELAEMIRTITGSNSSIVDAPPREGDVLHSLADIKRAKSLLGHEPSTDLSKRLGELLI